MMELKGPDVRDQITSGIGSPDTLHSNVTLFPSLVSTFNGLLLSILGGSVNKRDT